MGHPVSTVVAVIAALVAAFCFAAASLVQQTVARASGADELMRPGCCRTWPASRCGWPRSAWTCCLSSSWPSAPRQPAPATMRGVVLAKGD
jgi:hypothetical protein